jgi:hypothetical protein
MDINAKKDVLAVLKSAIAAIKSRREAGLHELSNHLLHSMSIYQDPDVIDVAVAVYSLDKILEQEKYKQHPKMKKFSKDVLVHLGFAVRNLQQEDWPEYSRSVSELLGEIQGFTKQIKFYIGDLLDYAKIKKGTKLYEHGLSLGQVAEAMHVTKWDLMPSAGQSTEPERFVESIAKDEDKLKLVGKLFQVNL